MSVIFARLAFVLVIFGSALVFAVEDIGHFPDKASQRFVGKCFACPKCVIKKEWKPTELIEKKSTPKDIGNTYVDANDRFHINNLVVKEQEHLTAKVVNSGAKRWTHVLYEVTMDDPKSTPYIFLLYNNDNCDLEMPGRGVKSVTAYITREF